MKKIIILSFLCGWSTPFFAMEIEKIRESTEGYYFYPERSEHFQTWDISYAKWILEREDYSYLRKNSFQPKFCSPQPFPYHLTIEINEDQSKYYIALNQTIDNKNYTQPIKTKNLQLLVENTHLIKDYNDKFILFFNGPIAITDDRLIGYSVVSIPDLFSKLEELKTKPYRTKDYYKNILTAKKTINKNQHKIITQQKNIIYGLSCLSFLLLIYIGILKFS